MLIIDTLLLIFCGLVLYYLYNGAMYVPTLQSSVEAMVRLSHIKPGMKIVDLGSGDGRIVTAFAAAGAEATGYEINPVLAVWSMMKIRRSQTAGHAKIFVKSFWRADLSQFDVIVVFGISHIMNRLETKLKKELKPGTLVISNAFRFRNLTLVESTGTVLVYRI